MEDCNKYPNKWYSQVVNLAEGDRADNGIWEIQNEAWMINQLYTRGAQYHGEE